MNDRRGGRRFRVREEIESQPDVWGTAVAELDQSVPRATSRPSDFAEVVFTGCGSTAYLAQWAAVHCRELQGVPALALPASELFLNVDAWIRRRRTLLVAISRSSKTTETVRAVHQFRERGLGEVAVVTGDPDQELSQMADWLLAVPSAAEQTVPQTRSFTSMMLAVAKLLSGPPDPGLVDRIANEGRRLLADYPSGLAEPERTEVSYTFLGTGPRLGLAYESMLKIKEMSLTPAEAFQTLEFRHGPISTVGPGSVVVALVGDNGADLELSVLDDVADLGATTVVVGPHRVAGGSSRHTHVGFDADLATPWRDVLYLPVVHQTALASAEAKSLDPDNPKNLQAVVFLDG